MSINTTANTAGTTKLNKTFYDRQLLESAKTRFVHAKYGQKRPIPKNSGKRVEFRKWNLFDANDAMEALQEGVTPASQALSQSNVEVEVAQYGAYVEVSDLLDMTGYDQVISESAELLGEQLGTVVEWVTRDAMNAGTNVQYANGKSGRGEITAADKLTVAEIRKAVRTLKRPRRAPSATRAESPTSSASVPPRLPMTFRAIPSGRTYPSTPAQNRYIPARSAACSAWYSWNPPRRRCSPRAC